MNVLLDKFSQMPVKTVPRSSTRMVPAPPAPSSPSRPPSSHHTRPPPPVQGQSLPWSAGAESRFSRLHTLCGRGNPVVCVLLWPISPRVFSFTECRCPTVSSIHTRVVCVFSWPYGIPSWERVLIDVSILPCLVFGSRKQCCQERFLCSCFANSSIHFC